MSSGRGVQRWTMRVDVVLEVDGEVTEGNRDGCEVIALTRLRMACSNDRLDSPEHQVRIERVEFAGKASDGS